MPFSFTTRFLVFLSVIIGSVFLVYVVDGGLCMEWTGNVIRNWEDFGFFRLHGSLVYNPGGYEALSHPQIYAGHRAASLYPAFFFEHLFSPVGLQMMPYFVILICAVFFSIWHLLGRNERAFWTAAITVLAPGFIRWQTTLDPNLACALFGFPFCAAMISLLQRPVLPALWVIGLAGLVLVYSSLNWTTAFIHAMLLATLLVMRAVSWRRVFLYAGVAGLVATAVVAQSLVSKSAGASGQHVGLFKLLQGYTWGDAGYGTDLTTKTAVLRVVFVNVIGLLPAGLWLVWNFRPQSGRFQTGNLRFFLPLLVAVSEIFFMRNYFGHHPWMSCHFFLLGLILTVGAGKQAEAPASTPVSDASRFRRFLVPALTVLAAFVYGICVLLIFRVHNANQFALVKFIRDQTRRADSIVIAADRDPKLAGLAERLPGMIDRHLVVVTNLAGWQATSGNYLLSASDTPDLGRAISYRQGEVSRGCPGLEKMLVWYSHAIARRRAGDKPDLDDAYYLYQKNSSTGR
jgi:hypothetical protein